MQLFILNVKFALQNAPGNVKERITDAHQSCNTICAA